jgi:HPt (histidine-containing phosphotransfer) domain-containing protein
MPVLLEFAEDGFLPALSTEIGVSSEVPLLDRGLSEGLAAFLGLRLGSIYGAYSRDCAAAIDLLEIEAAGGDFQRIGQIAHQMLGASLTLGMVRLASAFAVADEAAKDCQVPQQEWVVETRGLLVLSLRALAEAGIFPPVGRC